MRVVGGSARGRRLVSPPGTGTRPTSDRVREAVFNALWSRGAVDGARVLDLFAGSGALGIEALSRGAVHATFVDADRAAREVVRRNLEACGFVDRAHIVAATAERYLAGLGGDTATGVTDGYEPHREFDLAFCDPPYAFAGWDDLLSALPAPLVVIESDRPVSPPAGWEITRESRYGGTWVGFASRP
jgi:16S rRNA (guanine966-N2)-methyltransferase